MANGEVKLTADELAVTLPFIAACDAKSAGFRLGMEEAKRMFIDYLMSQRKPGEKKDA
jgi:hypothetical protein